MHGALFRHTNTQAYASVYASIVLLPMTSHCQSSPHFTIDSDAGWGRWFCCCWWSSACALYETWSVFSDYSLIFRANDETDDTISVRSKISFEANDQDKSWTAQVSLLHVNFAKVFRNEKQVGEMDSRWSFSFVESSTSWSVLIAPVFARAYRRTAFRDLAVVKKETLKTFTNTQSDACAKEKNQRTYSFSSRSHHERFSILFCSFPIYGDIWWERVLRLILWIQFWWHFLQFELISQRVRRRWFLVDTKTVCFTVNRHSN